LSFLPSSFTVQSPLSEADRKLSRFPDQTSPESAEAVTAQKENPDYIGFKNAAFSWTRDANKTDENVRNFKLVIKDLRFKKGAVNLIAGSTGRCIAL
jgi:hypothetical protein